MAKKFVVEQHNERLNDEQVSELYDRSPINVKNKLTLAQRGFRFLIGKNHNPKVVAQFLKHA